MNLKINEDQRDTTVPSTLLRPATITSLNHTPERRSKKCTPRSQEILHKMSALALSPGRSLHPPASHTHCEDRCLRLRQGLPLLPLRAIFLGEMGFAKAIKVYPSPLKYQRYSGLRFTALEARNKVGRSTTLKQGSLSRSVFRVYRRTSRLRVPLHH
jgi:hypothetical protein